MLVLNTPSSTADANEAGIGFAIKMERVGKLSGLMTLRLPLSGYKRATIVSAYAPTMSNGQACPSWRL